MIPKRDTDAIVRYVLRRIKKADYWWPLDGGRPLARWIRAAIKQLDKRGEG